MLPDGEDPKKFCITDTAYTGEGKLFNSHDWDGLDIVVGKKAAIESPKPMLESAKQTID